MNKTINIQCPSCSNSLIVEQEVNEVFCNYCGTKFAVTSKSLSDKDESEALVYIKNALEIKEYSEAIKCSEEMIDRGSNLESFSLYLVVSKIFLTYQEYKVNAELLYEKKGNKSVVMRMVTNHDAYGDDSLHKCFFDTVKALCNELAELCKNASEQNKLSSSLLCELVFGVVLAYKSIEKDKATYWTQTAIEHSIICLIPFAQTEYLIECYFNYRDMYPHSSLLPNQISAQKAMKAELNQRGVLIPEQMSFFDKIKSLFGAH